MDYDIRNELMPVGLWTISGTTGKITQGIDLSIPAKIRIDSVTTEFSPPSESGLLGAAAFIKGRLSDRALEFMLGSGNSQDPLTRLVWRKYNLPNWIRCVALIKFEMAENTAIEIRPVSPAERVAISMAISELKTLPDNVKTGEKIRSLVNRSKQFQVGNEQDLAPFVIPIYPIRVEGQKALSYRVFAVFVAWNEATRTWRDSTSFEVITTSNPTGNNFVVTAQFGLEAEGMPWSTVKCENRWVTAAARAAQLMK